MECFNNHSLVNFEKLSVDNLTENDILQVPNKALIEALASAAKYSIDDYTFLQRDCYGGTSR